MQIKSLFRKVFLPPLFPLLFTLYWIADKLMLTGLSFVASIGVVAIVTGIPIVLGVWYGWELKGEFNEQD